MIVRKCENADLEQVLQLFHETVHAVNSKHYSNIQIDTWASEATSIEKWIKFMQDNFFYVAEASLKVVGFGDITKEGYVNTLYTHKDFQGKGVGTALLKVLESKAKVLGVTEVFTEASITAKPFFNKRGYLCLRKQNKVLNSVSFINYLMKKTMV